MNRALSPIVLLACTRLLHAIAPCCAVTAVDSKAGIVTATENATGRSFTFKANATVLSGLRAGSPIYANFTSRQVSTNGVAPCCAIVSLSAASASAGVSPVPKALVPSQPPSAAPANTGAEKAPSAPLAIVPLLRLQDLQLKGVVSPDSENKNGEADPKIAPPGTHSVRLANVQATRLERLRDDPHAPQILQAVAKGLGGFQVHLALLGGHKYMVNSCLGIKASAGNFDLVVPDPDLRTDNTGVVLTFSVSQILFNALTIRVRPDLSDPLEACHFSGRIGIGGKADDVRLELHFDPVLDLEQCKVGSMGQVHEIWRIGSLKLDPLPGEVGVVAKNMVEDALTYGSNFNIVDRIVASINGAIGLQCHQ